LNDLGVTLELSYHRGLYIVDRELWDGPRTGVERAAAVFGADTVYPIDELDEYLAGVRFLKFIMHEFSVFLR